MRHRPFSADQRPGPATAEQHPEGRCLRCLRPARSTRPCRIEGGFGEPPLGEWAEHHGQDWTDEELAQLGLTAWRWPLNRRTLLADLYWDQLESVCERVGHDVIEEQGYVICDRCHHPLVWVRTAAESG